MKSAKIFISEEKYNNIIFNIYQKQECKYFNEALELETPIKMSTNILKNSKKYNLFSPSLIEFSKKLKNLNGYEELNKRKKLLMTKRTKFKKSGKTAEFNQAENEINQIKSEIIELVKYEFNVLISN